MLNPIVVLLDAFECCEPDSSARCILRNAMIHVADPEWNRRFESSVVDLSTSTQQMEKKI